ncbi:heterokaryon incompatibility protein-domain-containing protein [Hypoxylon trugodes]|uniref:heterokaryon incompatibility protein-domain-containing protein n=1 Tax=Hypoxylon trugodes TaxID=326681 RepID=UPI0021934695|nr:heterokaryon incompatibility protein-domain-containing protein [Hypoxylon trugodes]KAI1392446.1 heterokaryon incompatibility protein-domain-containing protein [Hypoxylon trugodes]
MPFLDTYIAHELFTRLDSLYRAFTHAAGAEVNGGPAPPGSEITQKERELHCIIPRVLNIVSQAEALVKDGYTLKQMHPLIRSDLKEVLRASKQDIGGPFYDELRRVQPVPLQVNGYEKYPELMKTIEEAERFLPECRIPEPFDLPTLPCGSGPMYVGRRRKKSDDSRSIQNFLANSIFSLAQFKAMLIARCAHSWTSLWRANYNYDDVPLPTRSSIRLVRINPTPDGKINLSLRAVDLSDDPIYATLSYTWGPPLTIFRTDRERRKVQSQVEDPRSQVTVPIICNGKSLRITENLYRFLRRWREGSIKGPVEENAPGKSEIWIDAICINQNDFDEKSIQVAKMGEIYRKCQGAYVWLGEEDCFSRIAIPLLYRIAMFPGDWNSLRVLGVKEAQLELRSRGVPSVQSWDFMCLFAFFNRSWFHRAWVCQEVAFAPELWIYCGDVKIADWLVLAFAVLYIFLTPLNRLIATTAFWEISGFDPADHIDLSGQGPLGFNRKGRGSPHLKLFHSDADGSFQNWGASIMHMENIRRTGNPVNQGDVPLITIEPVVPYNSIFELFMTSRIMKATNPRDRVYAFLNLAKRPCYVHPIPHSSRREIEPNYYLRVEEVYLEASWYLLLTEQNLSLLSRSEQRSGVAKDMPSWVLDWEAPIMTQNFTEPLHEPDWRASGDSTWEIPESQLYQPSLRVSGWKTSAISAVVEGEFCLGKAALVAADLPEICRLVSGNQSRVEVLWRTLTGDHVDRQSPAPQHCEQIFRHLWKRVLEEPQTDKGIPERMRQAEDQLHICPEAFTDVPPEAPTSDFDFISRCNRTSGMRTIFRTDANYLGNGPRPLKVGDQVWVLAGADIPFILRPQSYGKYQLVGEAYVHGIMRGEAIHEPGAILEEIELV